jgi:hypothetical protein
VVVGYAVYLAVAIGGHVYTRAGIMAPVIGLVVGAVVARRLAGRQSWRRWALTVILLVPLDLVSEVVIQSINLPASPAPPAASNPPNPAGFRVLRLDLRADPVDYTGVCPVKITFPGRITVAGGGGTVSYMWRGSDNSSSPVQTLTFDGPGSQDVSSSWTVDGATLPTHRGWESIEILDPVSTPESDSAFKTQVSFKVNCS